MAAAADQASAPNAPLLMKRSGEKGKESPVARFPASRPVDSPSSYRSRSRAERGFDAAPRIDASSFRYDAGAMANLT
jgi:hypothetical protein